MIGTVPAVLQYVKADLVQGLDAPMILALCREASDQWRPRLLDPVATNLRHLKQTMGLDVLHCQRLAGVMKELTVFALVSNLVRVVMLEAAKRQGVALERISCVDALRWLSTAPPGDPMPPLVVNPHRPDRVEPRAMKRRPKPYALLMTPRREARNTLIQQRLGA